MTYDPEYYQKHKLESKEACRKSTPKRREAHRLYDKERYSSMKPQRKTYDRSQLLKRNFNMSIDDYDALLASQEGKCAICSSTETNNARHKYFSVDHDHTTGKVRGLLCSRCNLLLGKANDDVSILQLAITYLVKHTPRIAD